MIKILLSSICIVLISVYSYGQKKDLTLEQAVLNQYRDFAPDKMPFFKWIPESENFTFLKGYTTLMKGSTKSKEFEKLYSIQELNSILNSKLYWFSSFEWKDKNTFYVNDGINFYEFNTKTKTGKTIISIDEKAQNQTFSNNRVAYTIDNNLLVANTEGTKIKITDNSDKNIVSGQTYARSEFGINNGIFWSPKGNLLAFSQKDESEVADYPLLDITTTPGSLFTTKYPMTGQKSEKPKIGIYNFKTLTTVFISPRGNEDDYLTNASWSPDEQYILIAEVNRDQNHYWLNKYDAKTGEFIKTLLEETNEKWVEPEHPAFFPNSTNNNFIWISEKDGFNNLYYYNIEGKLIKQLTKNKYVTQEIVTSIKNGTEIIYSATGENPLNTVFYKVNLDGKQTLLTREEGTHSIEVSPNEKWIFDEYSNHSTPSVSTLISLDGKNKKTLLTSPNKLENFNIGTTEIKPIKNKDGLELFTRLIKPSDFDSTKQYPVLVYVYGGPHAQMIVNEWLDGSSLWMNWIAEQGYLVFTIDNRGSNNRGFEFESGIHRQCGTIEMEDQITGVEYLKSLPFVDSSRLAVHGWSYGGFMTTSLMLRKAGTFTTGVAGGPVTDWKYYETMYGERYMDKPSENPEGYKEASLLTHANKLEGNLLLIHGTVDDVVLLQHNYALLQKFIEEGIQMDYFPYPMHKHNVYGKDRVHLMTKILNYIIEKNK